MFRWRWPSRKKKINPERMALEQRPRLHRPTEGHVLTPRLKRIKKGEASWTLPDHKTKIVCTIGPASESSDMMSRLLEAGMNVARLNFWNGDFAGHAKVMENLRAAAKATGRRVAIMADLPGPKMRIGMIKDEPVDPYPVQHSP